MSDEYYFDESYPIRVKQFIERFCIQSVGQFYGKPLTLLPWQYDKIIKPLYGWRRPDGTRRYNTLSVWLQKSNGKSSLSAALSLYELIGSNLPGAMVVNVASTVEQAAIVFGTAANMIELHPSLSKAVWLRRNIKTVEYARTKSIYKVMSGDRSGKGKAGFAISALVIDELAEVNNAEFYDHLTYNVRKRKDSLLITLSTAGFDTSSIGYEVYRYARAVLNGDKQDDSFLPVIYEADESEDWTKIETARKCNPSWGVTVFPENVAKELQEALNEPRKEVAYKTLRLSTWQGSSSAWLSSPKWDACGQSFDPALLSGRSCYLGLDLARKHDLASYVLLFNVDDIYYLLPRFFVPAEAAHRKEHTDHVPYSLWARQGLVTLTSGDVIDFNVIRQHIQEDANKYKIREVGFDPWNATQLVQQLQDEDNLDCVEIKQTIIHLGPATAQFERLVINEQLRHNGNPVLRWNAGNVVVRTDANNNVMIHKAKCTARIDGISASIMALHRAMVLEDLPLLTTY